MNIESRLSELGISLPEFNPASANYSPAVRVGDLIFTSGQTPKINKVLVYKGKLGDTISNQDGYEAVKLCTLNTLTIIKHYAGGLDNVARIVKLMVYINNTPDFADHAKIADGATDLLVDIFGDNGRPARSAVGMGSLPGNATCEIDMVIQLKESIC